jgi:DNA mismatch repair protein MutL
MPSIKINTDYNPFDSDYPEQNRQGYFERFEREEVRIERPERNADTSRKFFHIKGKYIGCPVISGLMLIDQKRAHERILFEKYLDCLNNNRSVSQVDLFPVTQEMNPSDLFILKDIEGELSVLGFRLQYPDSKSVTILGRPSGTEDSDAREMLEILLESYKNSLSDPSTGEKEKVAAAMAGASAIPYGKRLSQDEMENLFDTLFACKSPNYSPGGKPVISIFALEEIDKRFK